ncbi:dihydrodipicolinate synthase [Galdieria sulphuraria]|uniref:4-hydroxy-tetrahydrodipicolinate synthase n=1 Tax=Galdieria sulphuraria TaxID=130081 RepID=M2Y1A0_GALSU|nr:dihydrodipicolinate synthase [Galdieria sulphuraria]EME29703.1 dihydrodipicolinate synthase [Galdieria sulphuraria]|eukprot:XP_005706223.1 dihydrodipicolinate synthase [Galdieria sulphuraria]
MFIVTTSHRLLCEKRSCFDFVTSFRCNKKTKFYSSTRQRRWICQTRVATPVKTESIGFGTQNLVFGNVVTAMVTPFKGNGKEVDYTVAEQLAATLAANGSDALIIAGTTGESPTLTWSEQYELFTVVKGAVAGKAKVIAGAGSNSTEEAVEATHKAAKLGLDGTLHVVPYYNKPPQEGIYKHFKACAECEPDLPMMLYNIPGRTGINMTAETTARLSRIDNIVAVKEASGNIDQFSEIRRMTEPNFHMYAGDDSLTLPLLALGGSGVVSVASHFIGSQLQEMIKSYLSGNVNDAIGIHIRYFPLFKALFSMANPIPAKKALQLQGWPVGPPRSPLTEASPEVEASLKSLMKELRLL